MRSLISSLDIYLTDQVKWQLLKYEIHKLAANFPRNLAQNFHKLQTDLKTKITNLDRDKFNEYKTSLHR